MTLKVQGKDIVFNKGFPLSIYKNDNIESGNLKHETSILVNGENLVFERGRPAKFYEDETLREGYLVSGDYTFLDQWGESHEIDSGRVSFTKEGHLDLTHVF